MTSLPNFPSFSVYSDENTVGLRFVKWITKFENLLTACEITDNTRKKALLLHYIGDEGYDIFESFNDAQKGNASEYETAKKSLQDYFSPKKNIAYETFKFRQTVQVEGESIDTYYTKLRTLAQHCDFHDIDREILTQILYGCKSAKLRRRALRDNLTLDQILKEARAVELSESRADEIEHTSNSNSAMRITENSKKHEHRKSQRNSTQRHTPSNLSDVRSKQNKPKQWQPRDSTNRAKNKTCRYCGWNFPHPKECPAKGKECLVCHKLNHFARVCRSNKRVHKLEDEDSEEDSEAAFDIFKEQDTEQEESVCKENTENTRKDDDEAEYVYVTHTHKTAPIVTIQMLNTEVKFMIDTGATVNIMSYETYESLKCPVLNKESPKIYAYGTKQSLEIAGNFSSDIQCKDKKVNAKFFVMNKTESKQICNLLSNATSQELKLIQYTFSTNVQISEEFPNLYEGEVGKLKHKKIVLHIDKDIQPVAQPQRRIPFHVRKDVEKEIQRLEKLDIIEKVEGPTPWVSPVVVVPKKSGVRLCVDMRAANKAIKREKHPMPTIDDLIADLNGATVFSKLDMTNAYHQLELDESCRYITTFATHLGLRRYKRLLFGVNAASEIFQNAIAELLQDIQGARNLSDDIIIYGKTQADHDKALRATLKKLDEYGAKLNKEKCKFSVKQLKFYGHIFGEKGIKPDPDKIDTILKTEPPKSVGEVRSFLGMTQYVARFIPRYSTITAPLRKLTRKDTVWEWGPQQEQAFEELKQQMTSAHVMSYFDQNKETEILVDASPVGLGAILIQEGKPICYASRSLTETEQRYSQTDREMLAVVFGVEHFHLYLYGSKFTVVTDHKPLLGIVTSQKPTTARIERWRLRLMSYEMKLIYRPGKDDLNPADFISRHPHGRPPKENLAEIYINYVAKTAIPKFMTIEEVRENTKKDTKLKKVMNSIQSGNWQDPEISEYSRFRDELSVTDGIVLRGQRVIIPTCLQQRAVDIAHSSHQGIVKTKQLIREKTWFPGIDRMVEDNVKKCIPCQASYSNGPKQREPIIPTILPNAPWTEVSLDFTGPFPTGEYLMVMVDDYSRYPELEIIQSTSAKVVLSKLDVIFSRQGIPKTVKTDNGPPFSSNEFKEYAHNNGFQHRKITPQWPEANGEVERFMATLNKHIRTSVAEDLNWKNQLPHFLRQYRATPHTATKISPFEAMSGRKMNIGLPEIPKPNTNNPVHMKLTARDADSKEKMKSYADRKRKTKISTLKPGDQVLVKQQKKNKLTLPFNPKPYKIIRKKGSMITAQRGRHEITRNSSYFKALQGDIQPISSDEDEEEEILPTEQQKTMLDNPTPSSMTTGQQTQQKPKEMNTSNNQPEIPNNPQPETSDNSQSEISNSPRRYPIRNKSVPKKYNDFIMI